jgi:NTE family protein
VVLGSGGATGGAWEIGVLKGLRDAGVDVGTADLYVGCSIGATLSSLIQSGHKIEDLYRLRTVPDPAAVPTPSVLANKRSDKEKAYLRDSLRMWGPARDDLAARVELGQRALATPNPLSEEVQIEMKRNLGLRDWPNAGLKVAAVDVADGSVRFFDRSQGVALELAMAASSAQPGLQEPITIQGRRYMDGGVAGTNIDGAAGCDVVLAITAFPARNRTRIEIDAVRAVGGEVMNIAPDPEARETLGPNVSDHGLVRSAGEAGVRQGLALAADVRQLWGRA